MKKRKKTKVTKVTKKPVQAVGQVTVDAYTNSVSNIGTTKDKSLYGQIASTYVDPQEALIMYRSNWLAGRMVDVPVDEALREWREFTYEDREGQIEKIKQAEKDYDVVANFKKALWYAKVFGGSALLIDVANSGDIHEPLKLANVKKGSLRRLYAIDRRRITPLSTPQIDTTPEFFTNSSNNTGANIVHKSRLLTFGGSTLPFEDLHDGFWGDSIYTRLKEPIMNASAVQSAIASLVQKSNIDIFKIQDLSATLAKKGIENGVLARLHQSNMLASIVNSVVIDKDAEAIERLNMDFGGLNQILSDFMHLCASASGIPATKLLGGNLSGRGSSGLGASAESDVRNFYDSIKSYQEESIRPQLEEFDKILIKSTLGEIPEDFNFEFMPLWQLSEKDRAETELLRSQRDIGYVTAGILTPDIVAKELQQNETYPALSDGDIQALGDLGVAREQANANQLFGLNNEQNSDITTNKTEENDGDNIP